MRTHLFNIILNNSLIMASAGKVSAKIQEGFWAIICNMYRTVAWGYEIMLDILAMNNSDYLFTALEKFTTLVYTLAGVFMLFKITVNFINMLIDPDKISDKQIGAGAIVKRLFIVVILLISFQPSSFVFNYLQRLETSIIEPENGLINRLFNVFEFNSLNLDNISDNSSVYDCYFFESVKPGITNLNSQVYDAHHFKISKNRYELGSNAKAVQGLSSGTLYIEFITDTITLDGFSYTFKPYDTEIKVGNGYESGFSGCPNYFSQSSNTGTLFNGSIVGYLRKTKNVGNFNFSVYTTSDKFLVGLGKFANEHENAQYNSSDLENIASVSIPFYSNYNDSLYSDSSLSFASSILRSFIRYENENISDQDFEDMTSNLLYNNAADSEVLEAYQNEKIDIDLMISLIIGIAVFIYILYLVIDIILRWFKLTFLQVVAPIPIISYIDPKDKIFENWIKMYLSTYVDIFIKLIVMSVVVSLVSNIAVSTSNMGWVKLFFILGLLVFIKVVPSMINKLFGIDISSGSFKDISKIAKTGLGIAAGGAIAAGAGIVTTSLAVGAAASSSSGKTGIGRFGNAAIAAASGLGNTIGGTLRGIGGGSKGNMTAGVSMANKNMNARNAYKNGIGAGALLSSSMLGGVGADYATRMDRKVASKQEDSKILSEFTEAKDQMDNAWTSSKYYSSLAGLKDEKGNALFDSYEMSTARDLWMKAQLGQSTDVSQMSDKERKFMNKLSENNLDKYQTIAEETGKKSTLESALRTANQKRNGSSTIKKVVGSKTFESYDDIDKATAKINKEREHIESDIGNITVGNQKYRQSAAAREANKNNGGNK